MPIYRLEKDGYGPYWHGQAGSIPDEVSPGPNADGIPFEKIKNNTLFGFASLKALLNWFGHNMDRYGEKRFTISIYDVPLSSAIIGGRQVAFDKTNAKLIGAVDPHKFLSTIKPHQDDAL